MDKTSALDEIGEIIDWAKALAANPHIDPSTFAADVVRHLLALAGVVGELVAEL